MIVREQDSPFPSRSVDIGGPVDPLAASSSDRSCSVSSRQRTSLAWNALLRLAPAVDDKDDDDDLWSNRFLPLAAENESMRQNRTKHSTEQNRTLAQLLYGLF